MDKNQADQFLRAASLKFVLEGKISPKKANYRLRQALGVQPNGQKARRKRRA
jgi:hypothetical protein